MKNNNYYTDDPDLFPKMFGDPTGIEKTVIEKRERKENAVKYFETISGNSIGRHKEKQSNVKQKENKKGWSKARFVATLGAIAITVGFLGYGINKNKNEHDAINAAKNIVISKMESEGYSSKEDYRKANFDFDRDESILIYIFSEILDWQEMDKFIQSSTYNDGMYHYQSLNQSLTVNGFTEYDKTSNHTSADFSHWQNYCINIITDAYNNGTLEELITRLMLASYEKKLDTDNYDISYSFDLQGGRKR